MAVLSSRVHERRIREIRARAREDDRISSREKNKNLLFKSDGQEKSTKILISWQELKNQFLLFFVHR